ncbi:hypothetical protein S7335_5469 [Synechococcus sp. PCC 7335]|nr:hypothetical protein S7335_5469 [Synechococcus sp. PCC 7335]
MDIVLNVVTYIDINLYPRKPLIEPRDAIFLSLPIPILTHLLKRRSA